MLTAVNVIFSQLLSIFCPAKFPVLTMSTNPSENATEEVTSLKNANRQLLENQSFLHEENQKLQDNVDKLQRQLENFKKSFVHPNVLDALTQEKSNLTQINNALNAQIKSLKTPPAKLTKEELKAHREEQNELNQCIHQLDYLLTTVRNRPESLELQPPSDQGTVSEFTKVLTKRLEDEQRRSQDLQETIRRLREDDEKHILRDKIADMKHLITDLEVENTKLKGEVECLSSDLDRYQRQAAAAGKQADALKSENNQLEDEKTQLKEKISDIEHDNLRLKKEMIEELNEANRAKRVSVDTEMALQHISEAYENKRKEVIQLEKQLEEANTLVRKLQFKLKLESETA